jgi:hypothetical protein
MSSRFEVVLLANAAATGQSKRWDGGRGVFAVAGTFGGATVKLQFLGPDDTTWIDAGLFTTLTEAAAGVFELPPGKIRAFVESGAPSGLYATAARVVS